MKRVIQTPGAPKAIGPYSQGVVAESSKLLFTAGQVALDPSTGQIVGTTAAQQCAQTMKNLEAILNEAGSGFDRVIKTTIFLADFNDFASVNEVYGSYFDGPPPARSTVEVSRLPKDARIEIEMIAELP